MQGAGPSGPIRVDEAAKSGGPPALDEHEDLLPLRTAVQTGVLSGGDHLVQSILDLGADVGQDVGAPRAPEEDQK